LVFRFLIETNIEIMKTYILSILLFSVSIAFSQEWESVNSGTNEQLNSISFATSSIGFIGGNDSLLLKTTDGGDTWLQHTTNGVNFTLGQKDIIQVDFLDDTTGFLTVGSAITSGGLYKTIDGGMNWEQEQTWMCFPIRTYNFDADNSIAIGSGCFTGKDIDKKVNGEWGANATYLSWANDYLYAIDFYNTNYGMVAGDSGTVHRTFDGGVNWDTVATHTHHTIRDLKFVNDSTIYGVVDSLSNSFMISTDSGATWVGHNSSLTFFYPQFKALELSNFGEVIAVGKTDLGDSGFVLWGNEDAVFWNHEMVDYPLHDVGMASDSIAFAVGDSGMIIRNTQMFLGIEENGFNLNITLYPNPVNDVLTIKSDVNTIKEIHIYDVQGRRVQSELMNFDSIDINSLKAGVYYLRVVMKNEQANLKFIKR